MPAQYEGAMTTPDRILLQIIDERWSNLQVFINTLTPKQYISPTDAAGWSVQDHLLHLADWEAGVFALLNRQDRVLAMGLSPELWMSHDTDAINEVLRQNARQYGASPETVQARLNSVHGQLREVIATLDEAELLESYNELYPPGREYPIRNLHVIMRNTTEHYPYHLAWMRAIVESTTSEDTMTAPDKITTSELLAQFDEKWADIQAFIAALTPGQYTSPTDAAGWSVQDHLLHLAEWEAGVVALLNHQDRAAAMGLSPEQWTSGDYDAMNEVLRRNARQYGASPETVQARLNDVHQQLRQQITALSDADLEKPYNAWFPEPDRDHPIRNTIIGNTIEHYPEHIPWMQAIIDSGS